MKQQVTISCDASQTGLAAVLLQQERPVAYTLRALSDIEQRYTDREGTISSSVCV